MIDRRNLVSGGLAGVLGALSTTEAVAASPDAAAAAEVTEDTARKAVDVLAGILNEVRNLKAFPEIASVRNAQVTFLRATNKFPDYIEVGVSVWFAVHDWHIRWQQPLALGRDPLGRMTLQLNQTTVIMRPDAETGFIGLPYDNR